MYEKLVKTKFVQLFSGETVQTVFKLAYMWLVLLSFNSFFAETILLSYCSYALALFGAPIVLARVVDFGAYQKMPLIGLMCLFLVSFLVSAISTSKYGITSNVQGFAWMTFEFFILFAHSARESAQHAFAELEILAKSVCWYAVVCSGLGLLMCLVGYVDEVVVAEGVTNHFGVYLERLWGVYSDPNIGAVVCVLALLLGAWLFSRGKICAALFAVNTVAQFGYLAMSGSRGALLCLVTACLVITGLTCWKRFGGSSLPWRVVKATACAMCSCLLAAACVLLVGVAIQKASELVQSSEGYERPTTVISAVYPAAETAFATEGDTQEAEEFSSDERAAETKAGESGTVDISSRFDGQYSLNIFSAGRLAIWESALDIFASSPLTGVSHRNILPYAQDVLPGTFIALVGYTTMHNIFFDVLVSQGIVGMCLFVLMILLGLRCLVRFLCRAGSCVNQDAILAGILAAIGVAAMFYTEILYINSPASIVFWCVLGFICHIGSDLVAYRVDLPNCENDACKALGQVRNTPEPSER